MSIKIGHKSVFCGKHAGFHVVMHEEWRVFMIKAQVSAPELCHLFDVSRTRAAVMVKRKPRAMERLAMLAVFHNLHKVME
jgi:hypothetical protein